MIGAVVTRCRPGAHGTRPAGLVLRIAEHHCRTLRVVGEHEDQGWECLDLRRCDAPTRCRTPRADRGRGSRSESGDHHDYVRAGDRVSAHTSAGAMSRAVKIGNVRHRVTRSSHRPAPRPPRTTHPPSIGGVRKCATGTPSRRHPCRALVMASPGWVWVPDPGRHRCGGAGVGAAADRRGRRTSPLRWHRKR